MNVSTKNANESVLGTRAEKANAANAASGERRGPRLAYAAQHKNSSSRLNGDLATEAIKEDDAVYRNRNLACGGVSVG